MLHQPANGESSPSDDAIMRHNVRAETLFSAFNGVYMGLAIFAAPVVALAGLQADKIEVTILQSALPVGAFLGPLWVAWGRRWGMKKLVTRTTIWSSLPLLLLFWVHDAALFTALITLSQLLNSAVRVGQSSLYRSIYAHSHHGRIISRMSLWSYLTMVPTILLAGWLTDWNPESYRVLYPLAGLCGLISGQCFRSIRAPHVASDQPAPDWRSSVHELKLVIVQDRVYLLFQIAFFLSGAAYQMSRHVVMLLARDAFHFGAFDLSLWLEVVPQLVFAVSSPAWGRVFDRIGILRCRLLSSVIMAAYLACYFLGIVSISPLWIYLGSILQGVANAGGQLTWYLASSHFAPRVEDVPIYNSIHFTLNGVRGLIFPYVGTLLLLWTGPWAVMAATLVSLGSVPFLTRALGRREMKNESGEANVEMIESKRCCPRSPSGRG